MQKPQFACVVGDVVEQAVTARQRVRRSANPETVEETTLFLESRQTITSATATACSIQIVYNRVRYLRQWADKTIEYDSRKASIESAKGVARAYASLVGSTISVNRDHKGHYRSIEGLDLVRARIQMAQKSEPSAEADALAELFNEDTVVASLNRDALFFPARARTLSWKEKRTANSPAPVQIERTLSVQSCQDHELRINLLGRITADKSTSSLRATGEIRGSYLLEDGELINSTIEENTRLERLDSSASVLINSQMHLQRRPISSRKKSLR